MRFSIVTPSFRNSDWLKLCVASVADQQVTHEHIVQDSCSDDGTLDWLPRDSRIIPVIEKDDGMYDAVNRGFQRATGELLAYLNCDEQYLPGALEKVSRFFDANPGAEVVFADCVVVDASGRYVCDRKALPPQRLHSLVSGNLSFLTAATFMRRSVITGRGLLFDPRLRIVGDADWALRLMDAGVRTAVMREFVSTFTETGANLNLAPHAAAEKERFTARAPHWARLAAPLIVAHFRLRRLLSGAYRSKPYEYAIYTRENPGARRTFRVENPTFRWRR